MKKLKINENPKSKKALNTEGKKTNKKRNNFTI